MTDPDPGMNPLLARLQPYPFERLRSLLAGARPPSTLRHIPLSIGEPKHEAPDFVVAALDKRPPAHDRP